jgi:AP endonuclease-2
MSDGMFKKGVRHRDWTMKDLLPMSAKLIPEFNQRRSIKDMFQKVPSLPKESSSLSTTVTKDVRPNANSVPAEQSTMAKQESSTAVIKIRHAFVEGLADDEYESQSTDSQSVTIISSNPSPRKGAKRTLEHPSIPMQSQKKGKSSSNAKGLNSTKGQPGKGQSSLTGFFKPKMPQNEGMNVNDVATIGEQSTPTTKPASIAPNPLLLSESSFSDSQEASLPKILSADDGNMVVDPIAAKESWSKLLGKRIVPRCEHNEPCISLVTKKAGVNCGRSFYMCPRPIGPSGQKEKNSQWRCGTFIWSSDWTGE